MKIYKRNPLLKVICAIFILAHAIIGGRMVSTDNNIMGSIVIAVSLFWIFALINECTPYIRMDNKSLQVYSNFISTPREFVFNKEFQMYYHTRERLVFTYLSPRGIREKARVHLGYMDPEVSTLFVQEFRQIIAGYHPGGVDEVVKEVTAEAAMADTTEKSADQSEKVEKPAKKTRTAKAETAKAATKAKPAGSKKAKSSAETISSNTKTAKPNIVKKDVKKNKDSEKESAV